MATNVTPVSVTTTAYKKAYDVPIGASGKVSKRRPDGDSLGNSPDHPIVYPSPQESDGTWLGDPIHFDRA